jgi:hypothetical protein
MAAAERFLFFYPSRFWRNKLRDPGYRYALLAEQVDSADDELLPPQDTDLMVSQASHSRNGGGDDAGSLAKKVLRKIDMRLIPLLFVTYGLNFMDKTILSSASVFGLKDDTVRLTPQVLSSTHRCTLRLLPPRVRGR